MAMALPLAAAYSAPVLLPVHQAMLFARVHTVKGYLPPQNLHVKELKYQNL